MINFEFIRLAWETIRSHKVRSALTLLGMIIGVFAIIVAVTAVEVIKYEATSEVESFGSTTFTIERADGFSRSGSGVRGRQPLTYEQMERYVERAVMPAAVSVHMGGWQVEARHRSNETEPVVIFLGSNHHFLGNNGFDMSRGRFLTEEDVRFARPVAVIGYELADELFPTENPLGKDIMLGDHRYQVIGVMAEKGDVFGQNMDMISIVPVTRMIVLYGAANWNVEIKVRAANMKVLDPTMEEAIGIMRTIRRVQPGEDNNFRNQEQRRLRRRDHQIYRQHCHRRSGHRADHAVGGRHRHHEHHAGFGDGTHTGNWYTKGRWCPQAGYPAPVPL